MQGARWVGRERGGGVTLFADTYEVLFRQEDNGFLSPRLSGFGLFGRSKRREVLFTEGL